MAKGKEKDDVLYRVVKFEVKPTEEQVDVLKRVSDNLWKVYNDALAERAHNFQTHLVPLYEQLKAADEEGAKALRTQIKSAYAENPGPTLFDQINALTPKRNADAAFAKVPRNWQEETLDTLDGAFKSFVALRKNGDPRARTPKPRSEREFCEIPGRYGFSVSKDGKTFSLSCKKLAGDVSFDFPIPEDYQLGMLARAVKVKKFTLFRDERDMRKPGRFWVSLAYEIPKPAQKPFVPEEAVYVSLGASFIGVVSPKGEEVIPLWRADKHWKPKTDSVEARLKRKSEGTNVHALTPDSRKWNKLHGARRNMFRIMGAQQKQNRREVVLLDLILYHGVHFVVSDLVVRSKRGKLADGKNPERGGSLGLNWQAQNTGSLAYLVQWLEEKVKEHGGSVRKHKLTGNLPSGKGEGNKIPMARALRESFLNSLTRAA